MAETNTEDTVVYLPVYIPGHVHVGRATLKADREGVHMNIEILAEGAWLSDALKNNLVSLGFETIAATKKEKI